MTELDEQALEAAAKAHYESELFSYGWSDAVDSHKKLSALRAAITAYLAARPTPDAAAMEREVIEPSDECPLSERVDGKLHTWCFDGDDPYVFCHWCGEYRDALTSRVIRPGRKAVRS